MNDTVQEFEQICDVYYASWYRFHPQAAVEIGIYQYAGSLPPYDENSHQALVVLHEELITALEELTPSELDPDHLLDYQILRGAAYLERKNLLQQDWRYQRPQDYLPIHAVYQLQIRPIPEASSQFLSLLQVIPGYLSGAQQVLSLRAEQVPTIWADAAMTEADAGADFIDSLAKAEQWQVIPDLEYELHAAACAVREFSTFIQREVCPRAHGQFACGREYFEDLLYFRHNLPISADVLYAFGEQLLQETRQELRAVESELRAAGELAASPQASSAEPPEPNNLIEAYQQAMDEARAWVQKYGLVSMPENENLQVIETPEFLRHRIPFAAYQQPTPEDPAQQGYYYVTPASENVPLPQHPATVLRHTSVHEAYPGHHLQFVTAHLRAASRAPVRLLNASATLYEGWALYSEMLMAEQGFLNQPWSRYVLLRDRLWRALRVLIDIDLQVNELSVEAAAQRIVDELGFPMEQARGEVAWYTESPTVPMSYATGWSMICKLRDHQQQQPGFDLTRFHDQLLSCGSVSLLAVIQHVFGANVAQNIVNKLFMNSMKAT